MLCKQGKAMVKLPVLQVLNPATVRDLYIGRRTVAAGCEMKESPLNGCAVLYLFWPGPTFPRLSSASPTSSLWMSYHLLSQIYSGGYLVGLVARSNLT